MLELGPKRFECIVDTLSLSLSKVSVGLNFTLDVLKLSFQLFLALDPLHEHHVVVTIHLNELVVHIFKRNVIILMVLIRQHVLLRQLALRLRNLLVVLCETDAAWLHFSLFN